MLRSELESVRACLDDGQRRIYRYFEDAYAPLLLARAVGEAGASVADLKRSPFHRLLGAAPVKSALARAGGGVVSAMQLTSCWPARPAAYRVSLGAWGDDGPRISWRQTTRAGWNLVLRLEFDSGHDRRHCRLLGPEQRGRFTCDYHPVSRTRNTLAWARLDLDLDTGEVLIEELQTDWVRMAVGARREVAEGGGAGEDEAGLVRYVDDVLAPHVGLWDQAILMATIDFIVDELGIRDIWMHTWAGGNRLKALDAPGSQPPRSLYSKLPRRFCFRKTEQHPRFLREDPRCRRRIRRAGAVAFWRLAV